MSESVFYLHSAGLLSKWGFNDGAAPDDVLDYCDECGLIPMSKVAELVAAQQAERRAYERDLREE